MTTEQFVTKAIRVHASKGYDYTGVMYVRSNAKVNIRCLEHGVFSQTPNSHLNGSGCPRCKGVNIGAKLRLSADEFIRRAKTVHADKYDYSQVEYAGNHVKVKILCPEHGVFWQQPSNHLNGQGCPHEKGRRISATKRSNSAEFIQKARAVHGERYDYSAVQYVRNSDQVGIICQEHGLFMQIPNDHLFGYQCPKCGREAVVEALKLTQEDFLQKAIEVHGDRYDYSQAVYRSAHSKVQIGCLQHGFFEQTPANHLRLGNGCPVCVDRYSQGHRQVDAYLESLGVEIVTNTRAVIAPKELDTYIPSRNLAIEFNGGYWHSTTSADETSAKFKHRDKFEQCKGLGIQLLQIDQHEWSNEGTRRIWLSILRSKLGLHERKVYARKTTFRAITPLQANQFLAANHLQGTTSATRWCFGLFLKEELVAVMTFSGHQKASINLTRLAFVLNTTVIGGASKLFENALPLLPHMDIVTFANQRYSQGAVYQKMAFELQAALPPSYQWIYKNRVFDKRQCRRKHLPKLLGDLYDPTLTEHENMFRAGARCLYDAGYQRWIYRQQTDFRVH